MPARSRTLSKVLLAATATALATGLALWIWHQRTPRSTVEVHGGATDETAWNDDPAYVVDPVAGHRPRRSITSSTMMLALDDSDLRTIEKHRDRHGFLRTQELPPDDAQPRVLVLGDSHVDGVVDTADNVTSLLEADSARGPRPYRVLNAGCGMYSLWQDVLRARDLLARHRPRVVVIVVFLGNDFLDLENPTVPHLDDDLRELPGRPLTVPETTSARMAELAIPDPYGHLFWQGLDQALYLQQRPQRRDVLLRKSRHAVEVMEGAAAAADAAVVWVLLPSFDLIFPERTMGLGKVAESVVRAGTQRAMRDAFAGLLAERRALVLDLEPPFAADGSLALYAKDFHVYRRAHRLMADALAPMLATLLR